MNLPVPTHEQAILLADVLPRIVSREEAGEHSRRCDMAVGEALGWRVSRDDYWNWHPGPVYDPPGDEWCIRRDGLCNKPCNEALPRFTSADVRRMIDSVVVHEVPSSEPGQ